MESSSKKVNILKSVLKKEQLLHHGSGKNGKCIKPDIADIIGLASGSFHNSGKNQSFYTISYEQGLALAKAWGVRLEYLCGEDTTRTDEDYLQSLDDSLKDRFRDSISLCELLGYEVHLSVRDIDDFGISERYEIDSRSENLTEYKYTLQFDIFKDGYKKCSISAFDLSDITKKILNHANDMLDIYFSDKQDKDNIVNDYNAYIERLTLKKAME